MPNDKEAKRLFRRLLRSNDGESREIVTDNLRGNGVAQKGNVPIPTVARKATVGIGDRSIYFKAYSNTYFRLRP